MSLRDKVRAEAVRLGLHRPSQKEFSDMLYQEHKHVPCGYLRMFHVSEDHNLILGGCAINRKICPYMNYNAIVFDCGIKSKYFEETK